MKKDGGLGHRLGMEAMGERKAEALRAIIEVVMLLPHLRSSFAATFVQGLVAQLVLNMTASSVEAATFVLKRLIVTSPEGVIPLVR